MLLNRYLRGHADHDRAVTISLAYYTRIDNSNPVMRRPGTGVAGVAEGQTNARKQGRPCTGTHSISLWEKQIAA